MITYKNAAVCCLSLVLALAAGCATTASSQRDAAGKPTEGDGPAGQFSLDLGEGETMKFVLCPAGEFMMGKKDGRTYRLPTEAEWEYACRAGSTTRYCYGDDTNRLHEYSWYIDITWPDPEERYPHAAGTKKPNAWGIYDMHGNVWEACLDTQHPNYEGAPTDGSAWIKDGETTIIEGQEVMCHPLRGGGLRSTDRRVRTASRYSYPATMGCYYTGFRVVLEP